jgi:MFS family permease
VVQAARTGAGGRLFRALIGALILVSAAAQFALVPVMPVYARRFGLSGFEQGMVLGATGLATLIVSGPAGAMSDRFGPRRVTLAAGVLMAAATAAQALSGGFQALLAARLAFGAGYGMVWTAGLCWLAGAAAGAAAGGPPAPPAPPALGGSVAAAGVGGVAGPAASGALASHVGLGVPLLVTAAGFAVITAGLAAFRVPPGPAAPRAGKMLGPRAVAANRELAGAAAAVVTAGLSTGVCALLVPALLHAAGASAGRIGLYFAVAGIMFAVGSAVTAAAGRRAVSLPVTCAGMLVLAAALTPAVVGATPLLLLVMLCVTTAARSVLWTVSYSLAAGAGQDSTGLGASIGLLNLIWAATAVLGPLAAGLAAEHLGPGAAFGLTQAACVVALAVTATMTWHGRRRVRGCEILTRCTCCPRTGPITGSSTPNGSARPSRPWIARR